MQGEELHFNLHPKTPVVSVRFHKHAAKFLDSVGYRTMSCSRQRCLSGPLRAPISEVTAFYLLCGDLSDVRSGSLSFTEVEALRTC